MRRPADTIWEEISGQFSAIVSDFDAVIRAHVGGPVLCFEALSHGNARLCIGATRLRLALEAWQGDVLDALGFPEAALALTARAERDGRSHARLVLWLDPIGRRWAAPDDPFTSRLLDERAGLEAALCAILADVREEEIEESASAHEGSDQPLFGGR